MRGFSEPRLLVEVSGEIIEETRTVSCCARLEERGCHDQIRDSESVHRAGHRARLTTYRDVQMIVHHREATDGHRKLTSEFLEPALGPFPAVVFFIA